MDKNAIKKFAVWARRELIARVSQKAEQYGITEKNPGDIRDESVNGRLLTQAERSQRVALIYRIRQEGFQQVMEEVAYTWFNRFCALRFMEVNNYLPTRIRVFTDEENAFKPQILAEAIHMEMDGLDMDKVYQLKSDNKTEELYKYLLITQCNALYSILPGMFQQIADYTELLLPDNLLREGSVIEQMISLIPEEDWLVPEDHDKDSIQIIGWLYQYYNAEPKDQVFANLKKNIKISKHDIPAATQLFTPDWIVRYMVENSLGRLWVEGHPDDELKAGWKYYLEEAEQEPEVQAQLTKIREEYASIKPEDIKCIDPCMGSGHILVYMFDVLVQIYQAYGYSTREAVESIVENNLYGLDIDDRAAQLAYFAVMMKARQYDRRFFTRNIQPNVCAIQESAVMPEEAWNYFGPEKDIAQRVYMAFAEAKEYGSLIEPNVTLEELDRLDARLTEMDNMADYGNLAVQALMGTVLNVMHPLMKQARMLAQKYDVVVTNPPYMGGNGMNERVSSFVKDVYPDYKVDLFSCFVKRGLEFVQKQGYIGYMTSYTWMFLSSFAPMRKDILDTAYIETLIQPEYHSFFEEAFVPICTFVLRKADIDYKGQYIRLEEFTGAEVQQTKALEAIRDKDCAYRFLKARNSFNVIPERPIAYWLDSSILACFSEMRSVSDVAEPRQGMATADNNRFLRLWPEVSIERMGVGYQNSEEAKKSRKKWFPYCKGGSYRKWSGNSEYVVNWENDGYELKAFKGSVLRNPTYYFRSGLTWGSLTVSDVSFRYVPTGFLFDSKGPICFPKDVTDSWYLLGLLNSKIAMAFLSVLAPTMDYSQGPIGRIPFTNSEERIAIEALVKECIYYSSDDWNSFETSWEFLEHPFVRLSKTLWDATSIASTIREYYGTTPNISCPLELTYLLWQGECINRFDLLKKAEEDINRHFIEIYGLEEVVTPDIDDKNVSVRKANLARDIRSFISYAVGCMLGRYSIYKPGMIYAGGKWDDSVYENAAWIDGERPEALEFYHNSHFLPDVDGVLPICDDEYFTDDIVGKFINFVEVLFGVDTLEANLSFIANALGGSGNPKDVIRNYFLNDFYADHLKIYQKRPIYWLFDSGKKNGFKALIYMHRYAPDTIARIRTDYVHEQQSRYRTAIADLENRIISASTGERVKLNKQLTKVQAQAEELRLYEEKIHHLADQMISIDLDDGVKVNYAKFADVLAKIK